jgi:hypothetical protein
MMNPAMSQSMTQAAYPVPHAEYSTDTVIYKGGPPNQRGPLPQVSLGLDNKAFLLVSANPIRVAIKLQRFLNLRYWSMGGET